MASEPPVQYQHYSPSSGWEPVDVRVIHEAAVTLTVNGENWLSFACTPTQLEELAVGFLFNEGFIHSQEEIAAIDVCHKQTNVDVWLHHAVKRPQNWRRTSGCTGGFTAANSDAAEAAQPALNRTPNEHVQPAVLLEGMDQLLKAQELYRESGGVHCSAVMDSTQIRAQAEDIGRHNTLDKLAGALLLGNLHFSPMIVLTTGRISSEMLQKSARMGASTIVSRTSPTTESVRLAEQLGITLVGYARRNGFLVYAHPERLKDLAAAPAAAPESRPAETLPGC